MDLPSLRSLSLADVGEDELDWMAREGEHLLVERKREPPKPPGLGAEVASFANTIGGWLLLGIDDNGVTVGWDPEKVDRQSYLGDVLRNEVDPVPPFIAGARELDGKPVTVVRVLESADVPVLVRGTGALYLRDPGGKQPVDDHETLMALTRRGAAARAEAEARLRTLEIVYQALTPPDTPPTLAVSRPPNFRVIVRASPLTVTPQFTAWPIAGPVGWFRHAAMDLLGLPNDDLLAERLEPYGRGLAGFYKVSSGDPHERRLRLVADSGGVVGASLERPEEGLRTEDLRREFFRPLVGFIAASLVNAEAMGRSAWDTWISLPAQERFVILDAPRKPPGDSHCAGSLTIPAEDDEITELVLQWEREFARGCGIEAWEP